MLGMDFELLLVSPTTTVSLVPPPRFISPLHVPLVAVLNLFSILKHVLVKRIIHNPLYTLFMEIIRNSMG